MKKFAKYLWSWTFPAVVLFLVVFGNMSQAADAGASMDGGVKMCPPKRPADGGVCDPGTPDIPTPIDAGQKLEKKKVKIQYKGHNLEFIPSSDTKIAPAKAPEKKQVVDAGTEKPRWLSERRAAVMFEASSIAEAMGKKLGEPVRINNVFFAQHYSEKADAAVLVFATGPISNTEKGHKETALVLLFSQGDWSILPTDLPEASAESF